MRTLTLAALGLTIAFAQSTTAAELVGGYVDVGYSAFTDNTRVSKRSLTGSGEVAFTRTFGLQADLGVHDLNAISEVGTNVTLHGNFHVGEFTSLGVFAGRDDLNNQGVNFYGVEAGHEAGRVQFEGYASIVDAAGNNGSNGTLAGLQIRGNINEAWRLKANIDYIDARNGVDATRYSVGTDYNFGEGGAFYAEVGGFDANAGPVGANETFVGFGLRYNLGAKRGTTFGRRGFLDKMPGL
jgi:hypothetical protein